MLEKTGKIISGVLCAVISAAALFIGTLSAVLPDRLCIETGKLIGGLFGTKLCGTAENAEYRFGPIPIKPVSISEEQRPMLVPCGTPFGIKLRTEGVMAVSVSDDSPAEKAGICEGDIILSVNGVPVTSNSDISNAVQLSPERCSVILRHGDSERQLFAEPYELCGVYKLGLWVRDSAAGLGTMSYYDPETGSYGGLGHPVSDVTTGKLMPLSSGEVTAAEITDIVRGAAGAPGELCGRLLHDKKLGELHKNTECGIFGKASHCPADGGAVPMAFRQEVHTGAAVLLTTVDGTEPQEYDIEIEHISVIDLDSSKSMVIRITDPALLELTGGIVCGMSGSPIIQDGMLVGAVTHVFLNDPQKGYAIFCQTMLEAAENRE